MSWAADGWRGLRRAFRLPSTAGRGGTDVDHYRRQTRSIDDTMLHRSQRMELIDMLGGCRIRAPIA